MGIGQDEKEDDICTDVKNYDDLTESDGGIVVELKKKRVRKTVIGELKEANEIISQLMASEGRAQERARKVDGFARLVSCWLTASICVNIVLGVVIFLNMQGG